MIVSLLGLVTSLFAYLIAFPHSHQRRFDIYGALLAVHLSATVGYWLLSFEAGMDAFLYYRDPYAFASAGTFESGTVFVVQVVQIVRRSLGGSFLDFFILFQCFGMIGVALLARIFNEIADSFGTTVPLAVYAVLFLPGLHFWTSGIGKDSPVIMAVCLASWSVLRLERRYHWMVLALLIMVIIRPHIAAITVIGLVVSVLFTKHLSRRAKVVLAPVVLFSLAFTLFRALAQFNVDLSPETISLFVEEQQGFGTQYGRGANLADLPFLLKVFSLLFRPLFFDAPGLMGFAASVENAILIYIFSYICYHWRIVVSLCTRVPLVVYCVVFSAILITLLSLVSYNIGLGQRQKMMAIPSVLLLYGTLYMYKRYIATPVRTFSVPEERVRSADYLDPPQASADTITTPGGARAKIRF